MGVLNFHGMQALDAWLVGHDAGLLLVQTTWHQVVAEFPFLSVGITYLPIPVGGAITLLFIVERLWIGRPPHTSFIHREPASIN